MLQINIVEYQKDQINDIGTASVISSVSRIIDPSSLAQGIERIFKGHKDASFGIKWGSFIYSINGVVSRKTQDLISTQELMDRWSIPKELSESTILATTQRLIRSLIEHSIHKWFSTNYGMI